MAPTTDPSPPTAAVPGARTGADAVTSRAFAAVLFDLDGTLVDSSQAILRSWTTWAVEADVTAEQIAAAHGHGRPAAEIVADLVGPDDVARAIARIDELETADVADVVLLPGVAEALAALPPQRWAVVTSCGAQLAAARLRAGGVPQPSALVTFDDVERGKPDPACFLLGAERLGVDPADCLVVEDAPAGLSAARAAGCATLAVRTTHPQGPLDADLVVDRLTAVRLITGPDGVRVSLA